MYMRYRGGGVGHSFLPIANHEEDDPDTSHEDNEDSETDGHPNDDTRDTSSASEHSSEDSDQEDGLFVPEELEDSDADEDFDPEDEEGDIHDIENEEGFGDM